MAIDRESTMRMFCSARSYVSPHIYCIDGDPRPVQPPPVARPPLSLPLPVPISFAESRSCARLQPNAAIHQMEVKLAPFAISSWEGGSAQCTRRY